jgi:hypothetical protein
MFTYLGYSAREILLPDRRNCREPNQRRNKKKNICTTIFVQLSLSYLHYLLIISLPFSLSIVFDQLEERTTRLSQKLYQNSCSNIVTLKKISLHPKTTFTGIITY